MYEGHGDATSKMCYSSHDLAAVNPRPPLGGEATADSAVGMALCVEKTNLVIQEEFYTDTDLQSSTIFATSTGQKKYSYQSPTFLSYTTDSYYDQNDTIAALYDGGANVGLVSAKSGFLTLPAADFSGACQDNNLLKFENNIKTRSCVRSYATPAAFSSQCVNDQSVAAYSTNLWVGRTADVLASSGAVTKANAVQVTLGTVTFIDYRTGASTNVTYTWNTKGCATHSLPASAYTAGKPCAFSSVLIAELPTSNEPFVCAGFVTGVDYVITHNADDVAAIISVVANVKISDVPYDRSGGDFPVVVTQTFSALFHSQDSTQVSIPNGNLVPRVRSGNPGYYLGSPVLFGSLDASVSSTVDEFVDGMTIPSPITKFDATSPANFGLAKCPTSTQMQGSIPVKFGYDVATGCTVTLTRAQLVDMCCAGSTSCATAHTSPYVDSTTSVPYFLLPLVSGYVGIYGNADPLDATQWEPITTTVISQPRQWNDATGTCQNMHAGTDYSFLVAYSGEKSNPQNKIVAATANVITSNWVWTKPYGDTNSTQTFPLTVTASFIFKDPSNLEGYSPPAPPVLFKVPYDVFYPFLESPAPPSRSVSLMSTLLVMGACVVCMGVFTTRLGHS